MGQEVRGPGGTERGTGQVVGSTASLRVSGFRETPALRGRLHCAPPLLREDRLRGRASPAGGPWQLRGPDTHTQRAGGDQEGTLFHRSQRLHRRPPARPPGSRRVGSSGVWRDAACGVAGGGREGAAHQPVQPCRAWPGRGLPTAVWAGVALAVPRAGLLRSPPPPSPPGGRGALARPGSGG